MLRNQAVTLKVLSPLIFISNYLPWPHLTTTGTFYLRWGTWFQPLTIWVLATLTVPVRKSFLLSKSQIQSREKLVTTISTLSTISDQFKSDFSVSWNPLYGVSPSSYAGQPRAMTVVCIALDVSGASLTNISQGCNPCLTLRFSFNHCPGLGLCFYDKMPTKTNLMEERIYLANTPTMQHHTQISRFLSWKKNAPLTLLTTHSSTLRNVPGLGSAPRNQFKFMQLVRLGSSFSTTSVLGPALVTKPTFPKKALRSTGKSQSNVLHPVSPEL